MSLKGLFFNCVLSSIAAIHAGNIPSNMMLGLMKEATTTSATTTSMKLLSILMNDNATFRPQNQTIDLDTVNKEDNLSEQLLEDESRDQSVTSARNDSISVDPNVLRSEHVLWALCAGFLVLTLSFVLIALNLRNTLVKRHYKRLNLFEET